MRHLDYTTGTGWRRNARDELHRLPLLRTVERSNFHLYLFSDFHRGAQGSDRPSIDSAVMDCRRKKSSYAVLLGDLAECININDRRFSLSDQNISDKGVQVNRQRDDIEDCLAPIKHRILAALDGNHEWTIYNSFGMTYDLCQNLGCEYANGTVLKLIFPEFRLLCVHPFDRSAINSKAGDALQRRTNNLIALKRRLRKYDMHADCDVVVSGHYHKSLLHHPSRPETIVYNPETGRALAMVKRPGRVWQDREKGLYTVHEDDKYWMSTGAFLKAHPEDGSTYAERFGYEHVNLGYGHIEVRNDKLWKIETVTVDHPDEVIE